eukprot:1155966-Pelagomonas_calceolata.AAC.9
MMREQWCMLPGKWFDLKSNARSKMCQRRVHMQMKAITTVLLPDACMYIQEVLKREAMTQAPHEFLNIRCMRVRVRVCVCAYMHTHTEESVQNPDTSGLPSDVLSRCWCRYPYLHLNCTTSGNHLRMLQSSPHNHDGIV